MKEIKLNKDKISDKIPEIKKQKIETFDEIACSKGSETFDDIAKEKVPSSERKDTQYESEEKLHIDQYAEFKREFANKNIEFEDTGFRYVAEKDILSPKHSSPDWNAESRNFWTHHGNDEQYYISMAEKYPKIKEEIAKGRTIEELKTDPELKEAVRFWYCQESVRLIHYKDTYIVEEGLHRAELAKKYKLGNIPARVIEARKK
jgi:hypothetical protein